MKFKRLVKEYTGLLIFIVLMVFFRSALADWYTVPTASMQLTIKIGDRIVVNKMAYDLKIPLTNITLKKISEPKHGDIIVFESVAAKNRLIKRVIGLPGDNISMSDEIITLNGKPLIMKNFTTVDNRDSRNLMIENLPKLQHSVIFDPTKSKQLASFKTLTVPKDHYLVLGDNRRNSADSRVYGFVPRNEIKGKATHVAFSLNYDNSYLPRTNRFMEGLYAL